MTNLRYFNSFLLANTGYESPLNGSRPKCCNCHSPSTAMCQLMW